MPATVLATSSTLKVTRGGSHQSLLYFSLFAFHRLLHRGGARHRRREFPGDRLERSCDSRRAPPGLRPAGASGKTAHAGLRLVLWLPTNTAPHPCGGLSLSSNAGTDQETGPRSARPQPPQRGHAILPRAFSDEDGLVIGKTELAENLLCVKGRPNATCMYCGWPNSRSGSNCRHFFPPKFPQLLYSFLLCHWCWFDVVVHLVHEANTSLEGARQYPAWQSKNSLWRFGLTRFPNANHSNFSTNIIDVMFRMHLSR